MKHTFSLLFVLFFFISCGTPDATSTTKNFDSSLYSLKVPSSWIEIPSNQVDTKLPEEDFKAFRASYAISGIYPKLTILKEKILMASDSLTYATDNINKAPLVSREYTKLEIRDLTIDGQKTKVHIFQARPSSDTPLITFIQAYIVQGRYVGYTVNVSTSTSEKNYDKYIGLLSSFSLNKK